MLGGFCRSTTGTGGYDRAGEVGATKELTMRSWPRW